MIGCMKNLATVLTLPNKWDCLADGARAILRNRSATDSMPINCATTGNKIGDTPDQNVVRFAPKADIGSDITHARFVP
jgi:hypothetical protein